MTSGEVYRELAESAWCWVLDQVRGEDGPWLPDVVRDDEPSSVPREDRDSLYSGIAGLAPVLAEIGRSRPLSELEQAVATGVVGRLSTVAAGRVEPSLYDGLGGDVTALRLLAPGAERIPMQRLAGLRTETGWASTLGMQPGSTAPMTDLVTGTAGVVLAAVWAGGESAREIAATGGEALLRVAEPTPMGLDWRMFPGYRSSSPNYSHGTAGVTAALAVAGTDLGREDLVAAAQQGAQHLVDVASLDDDDGFVIPHTIPPSTREVEPVTYSWCHGPTGTSLAFAALAYAGVAAVAGYDVEVLRQRCLNSVLASGVPRRLRPGFWDNDGRCCGTAGVGDVLLDAAQDCSDAARADVLLRAGVTMGDALVDRAIRDDAGARWRFIE
ncbi:MAG: hypothetical protein QOJ49_1088, partial [Actinomycetota bacterium]|nr:hypothetical protein [Actinomycetota bacterium]